MPRNFNLSNIQWKDPRIVLRVILGVLLAANLAAAVIAFKPFGGSADDLRRERAQLQQQLTALRTQVDKSKKLVEKVEAARIADEDFMQKYVTDRQVVTSTIQGELVNIAENSGVVLQPTSIGLEPVEGSDTLFKMTLNAGCQGNYASLAKFINLMDRSQRFLIIESLSATPLQAGDKLNVTLKVDTYIRQKPGEELVPTTTPGAGTALPEGAGE
jgi:type IV pilus assembly protein PilO